MDVNSRLPQGIRQLGVTALLLFATLAPVTVSAADEDLEAAFQAMLADPGNVALTERYAHVAIAAADYEAAIGALEGLLMMSPDLTRVRVDLGILYYRLKSNAAAAYHLRRALADGGLSPGQVTRAEQFLVRSEGATRRHLFSGNVSAGLRFRSNANSGPDSTTVRAGGFDVVLNDAFREDGDGDGFFVGNFSHVYDFKQQDDLVLESTAFVYANRQFDIDEVNTALVEITTGPRLKPWPVEHKHFDLRPHMVANIIFRDDDELSHVYGVGLDMRYYTDERLRLDTRYQHRQRNYNNTADRPFIAQERDGHEHYFALNGRYLVSESFSVLGRFDLISRTAKAVWNDSLELGVRVRGDYSYAAPFDWTPGRWRLFAGGEYRDTDYDAANPAIDPLRIRDDREWRFTAGNAIPITGRLQAIFEVSGQFVESNLANFDRDNISTTLSMSYWF
ncbi:MAG: hypothetical protein AB7Q81_12500 [Gammaproteobacteria bacterium]